LQDRRRNTLFTKIYVAVRVQPRARKQEIEEGVSGELKLKVKSPPFKGEANREVIELLASRFRLPSSRVKIIRGQRSRLKLVSLEVDKKDLLRFDHKKYVREGKS